VGEALMVCLVFDSKLWNLQF